eukprot:jgi/Pico_ML_1/56053/g1649.t1
MASRGELADGGPLGRVRRVRRGSGRACCALVHVRTRHVALCVPGDGAVDVAATRLHAGLVGTYYCIDAGKLLVVSAGKASWMTGHAQGNPLAGAIGLGVVSALAVVLHLLSQQIHRNDPNHMAQIT